MMAPKRQTQAGQGTTRQDTTGFSVLPKVLRFSIDIGSDGRLKRRQLIDN